MNRWIKTKIKSILRWAFQEELQSLQNKINEEEKLINFLKQQQEKVEKYNAKFENLFNNLEVSVDHHQRSNSWAVISLQGNQSDYIKFVDLGEREIREIARFISRYDRSKVDSSPQVSRLIKIEANMFRNGEL